jgi:hypothetical protein
MEPETPEELPGGGGKAGPRPWRYSGFDPVEGREFDLETGVGGRAVSDAGRTDESGGSCVLAVDGREDELF